MRVRGMKVSSCNRCCGALDLGEASLSSLLCVLGVVVLYHHQSLITDEHRSAFSCSALQPIWDRKPIFCIPTLRRYVNLSGDLTFHLWATSYFIVFRLRLNFLVLPFLWPLSPSSAVSWAFRP
jgi:hypothetical protein